MKTSEESKLISVVLPAFNCEKTVESAVMSVIAQTYENLELIIVDDHSEDSTPEICRLLGELDKRIRIITNETNCGTLVSRAKAVNLSRGEWIGFIDADDLWHPEKLEKQLSLRNSTDCDLIYTASSFIDENGKMYDWVMHVPEEVGYRRLLKQNIISNSSVLVRKTAYIRYAPADEKDNDMHEDFACWLCMLRAGLIARGIDEPLITYRVSKKSTSGNKKKAAVMNMNTYKYIGLGFFERYFYEICYAFNGLIKYRHFR